MPQTTSTAMWRNCAIAALFVSLGGPALVNAQGVNRVSGLITDPSGAIVVGAVIEAKELSTNVTVSSTSNGRGYYLMQLPIGQYTVSLSCPGFIAPGSNRE